MDDRERSPDLYAKEFNRIFDRYLYEMRIYPDDYEGLTDTQKDVIQVLKRSFNRNKAKYGREIDTEAE